MAVYPDRSTFLELAADYGVIPVTKQVLADRETAVTAYEKLVGDDPGFLLASRLRVASAGRGGRSSDGIPSTRSPPGKAFRPSMIPE
jgi:hypothetical protein